MQVRAASEPPDHLRDVITTCAQTLSGLGQITAGAARKQAGNPAQILFPRASPRRAARYISGAADLAASRGRLPDGIPETAHSQLAATLRRDADALSAITTTDRSLWRQRSYETAPVLGFGTKRPVCTAGSDLTCRAHHRW